MRTLEQGEFNAGAIFFAVAILTTLVFGRYFCGWGCHIVALQDLCGWIMKKCGVRPKPFRSRLLVFIPLILAIYMFVWPTVKRLAVGPMMERWWPTVKRDLGIVPFPERGFTNHLMTEGFWDTFAPIGVAIPFLLVCGFATVYFLGAKGFCTYGCPYGGFFGPADLVSVGKIVVDHDKCHQCGHCTAVCTSNVRVHDEIREYGMVVDPGCMKCMDCVSVCPNGALSFGFKKPAVIKGKPRHKPPQRVLDTTIGEDLMLGAVFAAVFFAFRGAYDLVPMLFAVGIAGCATFLAWKAWQVGRDANVRLSVWQLKRAGRLTTAGLGFLVLFAAFTALTAHTGVVNWHRWRGDVGYERLALSKARVLSPAQTEVDEPSKGVAREALARYQRAAGWRDGGLGLVTQPSSDLRAALLMLAVGDPEGAEARLRRVLLRRGPTDELVADLGRVMLLRGAGDEALALYSEHLKRDPGLWSVRETWSLMMLQSGRAAEAIAEAEGALAALPPERFTKTAHARTRLTLARLYLATGRGEEALAQVVEGTRVRQEDPVMHENVAAIVLQVRGDLDVAIAAMSRAVELEPGNEARREVLERLKAASASRNPIEPRP